MSAGRYVFYNNSAFDGDDPGADDNDDNAIAPDKVALLLGQRPTFQSYTSYKRGINGIMVDLVAAPGPMTATDFEFKVGNDNNPDGWTPLSVVPTVDVRPGEGADDSDRVTIIFPDNEIEKQWLQVTVLANDQTGLIEPDVFYFGNGIGGKQATRSVMRSSTSRTCWQLTATDTPSGIPRGSRTSTTSTVTSEWM